MKRQLAYRTAAYAGIVTQIVFGLVLVAIFAAFYANGIKAPMNLPQVTTYIWLGQAFFAMTPYSVIPDAELREQIRDGSVATELLRPVDLHSLWMARTLASKLAPTALRCIPVIVVATLFARDAPSSRYPQLCRMAPQYHRGTHPDQRVYCADDSDAVLDGRRGWPLPGSPGNRGGHEWTTGSTCTAPGEHPRGVRVATIFRDGG